MVPKDAIYTIEDLRTLYNGYIHNAKDQDLIERAYAFAEEKHRGQRRRSGQPYITHPVAVAYFLAQLHTGPETIAAGLLHDTEEDTGTANSELRTKFGDTVANMVEALTKISDVTHKHDLHIMAEDHRKIFVAMAKDIRVILIKLCDRMHNMSTLQYQPREKQIRISQETLDVYAPIAHRLGLYKIQLVLEDLALFYLRPDDYAKIEEGLKARNESLSAALKRTQDQISELLSKTGIPFQISSRVKSIFSIYKKMQAGHSFDEIYDLMALRIITETENQCYEILGYIHASFKPIPGRFKDYIAMPKPNMYQSLHTTIIADSGNVFEVQIRTREMDEVAEEGVAAHWRYKEGDTYDAHREQTEIEDKLHWFRDFVSISDDTEESQSAQEYVHTLQHDIFDANVYVFTPMGKVICLPRGSTPIDFAYRIHTQVGDTVAGARINGVLVPISTPLKTGDICEIKTSKDAHPNPAWLNMCASGFAKNKIRKYLSKTNSDYIRKDQIQKGRTSLVDSLKERHMSDVDVSQLLSKKVRDHFHMETEDDLLYAVYGKSITPQQIIDYLGLKPDGDSIDERLRRANARAAAQKPVEDDVLLDTGDRAMTSLASCCRPIPGDDITGFITKGSGIKIHRVDCPNVKNEKQRLVGVIWNPDAPRSLHPVDLAIICNDRPGLLVDVMNALTAQKLNVLNISAKLLGTSGRTRISVTVMVQDTAGLSLVEAALNKVKGVVEINRVTR